ncbi:MAG: alpha-ketoglutarate-dependent taurine dioxygenase [Gammaproteobacteria bacterium]|jgi:taurine dioxygenase
MTSFTLKPLTEHFGQQVSGLDLAQKIDQQTMEFLAEALMQYKVLLFRDQQLADEEYARFGRSWAAKTRIDGFEEMTLRGYRDINLVGNIGELFKDEGYRNGAAFWHTDCAAETNPNATTMLYCIHALAKDGETVIADMELAYEMLDESIKNRIDKLQGLHCYAGAKPVLGGREEWEFPLTPVTAETADQFPPAVTKPLVRAHSITERPGLYAPAGSMFAIEDMPTEEAHELMRILKQHATQSQFCYVHQYRPGDVLMWDNSSTMHYATPTAAATTEHDRRLMYRVCPLGLPMHYSDSGL